METARGMAGRARAVADYVAGMTDRYAFQEHARLSGKGSWDPGGLIPSRGE
jgi:dGTPase